MSTPGPLCARLKAYCIGVSLLLVPAVGGGGVHAEALQLPAPPAVAFAPRMGARLPLDVVVRDETGRLAPLGRWFGRGPVVLVPGYYRCRNLCGTLFEGVLQALALVARPGIEIELVGLSIDPNEQAPAAAARRRAYASLLPSGAGMALLTADFAALARIEAALGYRAVPDTDGTGIAHPAGFVVAAADGRIVRYFPGVRFDPVVLAAALRSARDNGSAAPDLTDRLFLLCSHYDPVMGRHTFAAMTGVRVAALSVLSGLAAWLWRRWRRSRVQDRRGGGA